MKLTRRSLLQGMALASAHAAFGRSPAPPRPTFPTDPRHRIAVATYPFRAMLIAPHNSDRSAKVPGIDLAGFAKYIRTEFNVYGIEPLHSHFPSTELSEIVKLKAAFDAAGVFTANIPVDEQADLCSADAEVRKAGYAVYRRWVDIAVLLASPSIRISVPGCAGPKDIAGPANALKPVIEYASSKSIIVNLENDDPVLANDARIVSIIQTVQSPYLRALPDFANSLMGGDEAFNAAAVRNMFRYATNIAHVKDAETIEKAKRTVSLEQLFTIAREAKFKGFYSMESDSDVDPAVDTRHLIERCLALM